LWLPYPSLGLSSEHSVNVTLNETPLAVEGEIGRFTTNVDPDTVEFGTSD
jgi:hypothetical protein